MLGHRPKASARSRKRSQVKGRSASKTWLPVLLLGVLFCVALVGLRLFGSASNAPTSQITDNQSEAARTPNAIATLQANLSPTLQPSPTVQASPTAEEIRVSSTLDFARPADPFEHEINTDFILTDPELEALALKLINQDRSAHGLAPVAWDPVAAQAARLHTAHMASLGFFSHWSPDGHGPQMRANRQGIQDLMLENNFYASGFIGLNYSELVILVNESQKILMESPGHRANILNPYHTHVGVGIAYNSETGDLFLAQEFIDDYIDLEPLPYRAKLGDEFNLKGIIKYKPGRLLLNMNYLLKPSDMSIDDLNATGPYSDDFTSYYTVEVPTEQGRISVNIPLNNESRSGFYVVLIFMEINGKMWPVIEHYIEVS